MNFTFAHPWLLLLLAAVPWLVWQQRRRRWTASLRFASVSPMRHVPPSPWLRLGRGLPLLRAAALGCLILAFARPQKPIGEEKQITEGIDIVLCLDVSGSMLAEDFEKEGRRRSRVDVVRDVVREFIQRRENDRIAMIAFAGRPYT
ncbi:MAG: VWA domain-containing protein, partial [Verrucomicrobiae bacterium]|nr:VWA domain-containing protein [Verrucomicrobiae bacterium]